jgi:hypothetical protein
MRIVDVDHSPKGKMAWQPIHVNSYNQPCVTPFYNYKGGVLKALYAPDMFEMPLLVYLLSAVIHDYGHKGVNVRMKGQKSADTDTDGVDLMLSECKRFPSNSKNSFTSSVNRTTS